MELALKFFGLENSDTLLLQISDAPEVLPKHADEEKLSGAEEELEHLKTENVAKQKPKLGQVENETFATQEQQDKVEALTPVDHKRPKSVKTKPKDSEEKIESVKIESSEKLEAASSLKQKKSEDVKIKPRPSEERMESVEISNEPEDLEALEGVKVIEPPNKKKLKSKKTDSRKESLGINQVDHVEVADDLEDFKTSSETTKPENVRVQKVSLQVESKEQFDTAEELKESGDKVKPNKLHPKPAVDKKEGEINVQTIDSEESVAPYKEHSVKDSKQSLKPSQVEDKEKYVKVNVQDKVEKAPSFEDDEPDTDEVRPSRIQDRKESFKVGVQDKLIEKADSFEVTEPETDLAKTSKIPDRRESLIVDSKDVVKGVINLEQESPDAGATRVQPSLSKEKRRSVSVTRQEKIEEASDINTKDENASGELKIKSKKVDSKKDAVLIQKAEKEEATKSFNDEVPEKSNAKSAKLPKSNKDSVSVDVSPEKVESVASLQDDDEKDVVKEKLVPKKVKQKKDSIGVASAPEQLDTAAPIQVQTVDKKASIKPQNVGERRPSLNVSEIEKTEALQTIPQDENSLKPELAKQSIREDDLPTYLDVDVQEKVETLEHADEVVSIDQEESLKPSQDVEEKSAMAKETTEKIDSAKPFKVKIERKERAKPKSSEKESMIVDLTEKSEMIEDIKEAAEKESSAKAKSKTTQDKKDSVEITSSAKIEEAKALEAEQVKKGQKNLPEEMQEGSEVSVEDQIETLGKLSLDDSITDEKKKQKGKSKVKSNKAALKSVNVTEESAKPSPSDSGPDKEKSSVQLEPLSPKALESKVSVEESTTTLKPNSVSDSQQSKSVIHLDILLLFYRLFQRFYHFST